MQDNYITAWNDTMVKIWKERIVQLGVFDRRRPGGGIHLLDTIRAFPIKQDGRYEEITLQYSFALHGLYQDRGTGKEKARGNGGDIGPVRKDGKPRKIRQPRPWFSRAWYSSTQNLKETLAQRIGEDFVQLMVNI